MTDNDPQLRIGCSGWQYDHWKEIFYPESLAKADWFSHYADHFDTVEVNNTFYHLPEAKTFQRWHDQARPNFRYTLKFSRYGSHLKKLKDPGDSIGAFLDRAELLKSYLGTILVQLPPHWNIDPQRLDDFLAAAPDRHDWAVEFRDPSWLCDEVFEILRRHAAALCIHDLIDDHPRELTADWVYLRFHGAGDGGSYSRDALAWWAGWIRDRLDAGMDVWAYFNNDAHGYALDNSRTLRDMLAG